MTERIYLYVGTYTRPAPYLEDTNGEGIYVYNFDSMTGELSFVSLTEHIDNPSFLAIDPQKRHLYAASEVWLWPEGRLSAFEIDQDSGELSYLNVQPTRGAITAYVSVEQSGRMALLANFWTSSVVTFPINDDGSLEPVQARVLHEGSGSIPGRQDAPHPHFIAPDPQNRYAIVADLGIDKVLVYRTDLEARALMPSAASTLELEPGAGPRHVAFHPNGEYAYVIKEMNSTISALAYNASEGNLELLQTVPALPDDFDGESHCADIHVSPSGRFLYGSNRGHDSLVIYEIDEGTGKLNYVGHQSTLGRTPRNFTFDPTGDFLLVGNQDSDSIVTFRVNQDTGLLEQAGPIAEVPTPVCLKMITL